MPRVFRERLGVLDQDPVLGLRVEEADHAGEPLAGRLVDQRNALRLRRLQLRRDVVGREAHVVQALAALLEELRDAAVRIDRLEQLDLAL